MLLSVFARCLFDLALVVSCLVVMLLVYRLKLFTLRVCFATPTNIDLSSVVKVIGRRGGKQRKVFGV